MEQGKRIVLGRLASGAAQDIERSIDSTGYVRSTLVSRADAFANTDNNGLSHDRPGRVSMRRGGGNFEFVIAPAANPSLDADYVVIGQVLTEEEESADLLPDNYRKYILEENSQLRQPVDFYPDNV